MSIENFRDGLGDHAKDIKINLGTILTEDGAPELTRNQIFAVALASAYATKSTKLVDAVKEDALAVLSTAELDAAKVAATVMGMNNIYYRFVHLLGSDEYKTLPAKLRMNVIGNPGVPKVDFELYSLAVSVVNGCGMCIEAHVHELGKAGVTKLGIQSVARIAAVINAAAQGAWIAEVA